ncbi:unnamed protein product [Didymodactylos carnosus]|uniref:Uncharacterized protein n=2 Tax=Didymodactylos carnosus TaxID=1234261 RepID=A0A8S2GSE4_9BILA|nr:unnamed protein product [Didymodactylos carnosus]CAF3546025.1 unnamed protein product [Didymodactylos carnosus]
MQTLHKARFEWLYKLAMSDEESDDEDSIVSSPYTPSQKSSGSEVNSAKEQKRMVLNKFLQLSGIKSKIRITRSYRKLTGQSKHNFLSTTRIILKSILSFVATSYVDDVWNDLLKHDSDQNNVALDGKFLSVMNDVTETYHNAESWSTRRQILSIVAPKISFKLIQSFLPGLTLYRFTSARMYGLRFGAGALIESSSNVIHRFDNEQLSHFIDFIVSEHVCTDMPFGEKILKLSNGIELYVPETIRNMIPSRIVEQYYQYCCELFPGFQTLGPSSLYKILNVCQASTRKSLQGLNYFAADGSEAFDSLIRTIQELTVSIDEQQRLIKNFKRDRQYLKSDFKVHVSKSSTIGDHCVTYAVSDKSTKEFRQLCDHKHDDICIDCANLSNTLVNIEQYSKTRGGRMT